MFVSCGGIRSSCVNLFTKHKLFNSILLCRTSFQPWLRWPSLIVCMGYYKRTTFSITATIIWSVITVIIIIIIIFLYKLRFANLITKFETRHLTWELLWGCWFLLVLLSRIFEKFLSSMGRTRVMNTLPSASSVRYYGWSMEHSQQTMVLPMLLAVKIFSIESNKNFKMLRKRCLAKCYHLLVFGAPIISWASTSVKSGDENSRIVAWWCGRCQDIESFLSIRRRQP